MILTHYNDLRDFHNNKFIIDRLEEILGVYGWNTFLYVVTIILKESYALPIVLFDSLIYSHKYITENIVKVNHELNIINKSYTLNLRKQIYNSILENISLRFKDGFVSDPITTNKYICHIINNGYLSLDKKINKKNMRDNDPNFAYNILRGFGVCRNFAYLTTDIFRSLGFEAYDLVLYNYFNKEELHAITMVLYDEKLYFFDNLNKADYNKKLIVLNDNKTSKMFVPIFYLDKNDHIYKAIKEIYKNRFSLEKVKEIYEKYKQIKNEDYYFKTYPKELKKIYTDNKKNYKNFIKTYY